MEVVTFILSTKSILILNYNNMYTWYFSTYANSILNFAVQNLHLLGVPRTIRPVGESTE